MSFFIQFNAKEAQSSSSVPIESSSTGSKGDFKNIYFLLFAFHVDFKYLFFHCFYILSRLQYVNFKPAKTGICKEIGSKSIFLFLAFVHQSLSNNHVFVHQSLSDNHKYIGKCTNVLQCNHNIFFFFFDQLLYNTKQLTEKKYQYPNLNTFCKGVIFSYSSQQKLKNIKLAFPLNVKFRHCPFSSKVQKYSHCQKYQTETPPTKHSNHKKILEKIKNALYKGVKRCCQMSIKTQIIICELLATSGN